MKNNELDNFYQSLDRSLFIDNENKKFAHCDNALHIGHEQTISQPSLVYEMTSRLELSKEHRVLEIGTGSGYQTAFLAEFAGEVYSVEKVTELSWKAVERLMKLGYENINFKIGNGSEGWNEYAPYDRIIVTAAAGEVPEPLVEQLKNGGRMLIPVGGKGRQDLVLIKKDGNGNATREFLKEVSFVELKGDYGWKQ